MNEWAVRMEGCPGSLEWLTGHMRDRYQELLLGGGGMPRNWGSEAGVGDRGAFAFTTSPVDCLKLHNESPFYFFSFLFFFFS